MKNIIFNKITISLTIIFFVLALLYTIMLINTNPVVYEIKNIMLGNVPKEDTIDTPLRRYNFSDNLLNAEVKVKITRLFVLHNFFDGYMWVKYSYKTIKNDKDIMTGEENITACWKIHRENGKWKITEIKDNLTNCYNVK